MVDFVWGSFKRFIGKEASVRKNNRQIMSAKQENEIWTTNKDINELPNKVDKLVI